MNRNVFKLLVSLAMLMIMIMTIVSADGKQKAVDSSLLKPFIGEWKCGETPLEYEDYYTGFLTLRIQEEGTFSMYDVEAGNPGISGEIEILSDTELVLNCNAEDDFDPPPTWENMNEEQTITYKFASEYELHMMFENDGNISTLVFHMGDDDVSVDTFVFMEDKFPEGDIGNLFYVPSNIVESMSSPELYLMNNGLLFAESIETEESADLLLKRISLEDGSLCGDNRFAVSDDAKIQFGEGCIVLHDETKDSIWVMDDSLQVIDSGTLDSECGKWYMEQEWSDGSYSFPIKETPHLVSSNIVWSGYWQGYFFVNTTEDGSRLMFWNTEKLPTNSKEAENEQSITMDEVKEKASELSEKYGVDIRVGDDCDLNYVGYSASLFEKENEIATSLNVLETCFENYPEGFMEQLLFGAIESIRIELVDDLRLNAGVDAVDAAGFVEEREDYIVVVLEADFLSETSVYHELTHLIDKRLEWDMNTTKDSLFSEEKWLELQPEGFDYAYSYTNIPESVKQYYGSDYFVSEYACTFPTEDRATMMEMAMIGFEEEFAKKSKLKGKLEYYSACIRDCFDTKTWTETTKWEKY